MGPENPQMSNVTGTQPFQGPLMNSVSAGPEYGMGMNVDPSQRTEKGRVRCLPLMLAWGWEQFVRTYQLTCKS